ncbi:MurR/RpiR family transcriptional regulator [Agrobacterium tumefaciens]|uniref:MurR/RpiR family transcriptional regulator n=1 Tax=Agrobacterium tumefaciens TaxID=358 RepID=UPI000DCF6E40|nr:RpiR family carbohydrate utilization transcriptional regulator [Rhizobium nepotum]UXU08416.1 MurR/RpiR family transcriptional regulator [Agrobacterium tumefaciens]
MLDQIRQSLAQFTPAERKIAEAILETPSTAITWSITDAARIARVSEPSIVRFCRRLDCDGFPDFRMKLAQQLAIRQAPSPVSDNGTDPFTALVDDVFARALASLGEARHDLNLHSLHAAVDNIANARRVDVYGYGGSGFLAGEAQHRLASLGIPSVAYSDPTLQMVSAPRLTSDDVLLVLSFSGRTSYLISNIEIAKKAGARLIAISPSGSLVASLADQNINLNAYRSSSMPGILPTGRAPMYVMLDVIFALLAQKLDLQPQ